MTIIEQAMQPEVLNQAWNLLKKEHTPWSVKVNRDQLQQNLMQHLLSCRDAVLAGQYRPEPIRQFALPKPDGKQRVISAQYLRDKLVQRSLLIVLEPTAEALFHYDSYAYRRGRSVKMAINKAHERIRVGQDWLVDADIRQFFDKIPLKPLQKQLKTFLQDTPTFQLVNQWLKQGVHSSSLLGTSRGISQGAILSPLFCNLYMNQFDQALNQAHIPFVRFADDFLLFATERDKAEKALNFAQKKLGQMDLELHPDKTQVVRSSRKVIFLGEPLPKPNKIRR
jgi:RNA-directed DNA polymerase